jgi:hypothetical protein
MFEVIVRPVVFPNIRPAPPRVLAPEDDPTQGIFVLSGGGGGLIDLPRNWSVSVSKQFHYESRRVVDKERVKQVNDDGTISQDNFIDVDRMKKVRLETETGPIGMIYHDSAAQSNVDILESNVLHIFTEPAV